MLAAACRSAPGGGWAGGLSPSFGPTDASVSPAPYVGCYEAHYGRVREGRPTRWTLELDSAAARSQRPGGGNGLPARRARTSTQGRNDPFWRLIPRGVQLHVGDTLHGRYIEFELAGDSLVGREFPYSDVVYPGMRPTPVDALSAHRIPCEGG